MLSLKRDKLDEYDNDIADKFREINKINNEIMKTEKKKHEYGFNLFNNKQKRRDIISEADKYGFSKKKIEIMNQYANEWNQDNVTNDVIDVFHLAEKFVKNCQEGYKNNFLYKLSKMIDIGSKNEF